MVSRGGVTGEPKEGGGGGGDGGGEAAMAILVVVVLVEWWFLCVAAEPVVPPSLHPSGTPSPPPAFPPSLPAVATLCSLRPSTPHNVHGFPSEALVWQDDQRFSLQSPLSSGNHTPFSLSPLYWERLPYRQARIRKRLGASVR